MRRVSSSDRRWVQGLRKAGIVGGIVAVLGGIGWLAVSVPLWLGTLEVFRVADVEFEGVKWTPTAELRAALALPDSASVWHDIEPWAQALESHAMILRASVRRKMPSTLVFSVEEREPVALAATPMLEIIDRDGHVLPLDPSALPIDLPIVHPVPDPAGASDPEAASDPVAVALRLRPGVQAVERMRADPVFYSDLSEVLVDERGQLTALWGEANTVTFRLSDPVEPGRLHEGLRVLDDALQRFPNRTPREVDLRFVEQVVVRFNP
jgi:hypothetical protein